MAVSTLPQVGSFLFIQPKINELNYDSAQKLHLVLSSNRESEIELNLSKVKQISNLGARILSKCIYQKNIQLSEVTPSIQQNLEWATDYLYEKGELE